MKTLSKYSKFIPYLYFITVIGFLFTNVNKTEGITAFPILLAAIPFLWQLIKPSEKLNFALGIIFVCLSSYLILGYLSDVLQITSIANTAKDFSTFGGIFVMLNFFMALWMIRNSIKKAF